MKDSIMDDREFIDGVWRKVRFLEYLREEENMVKVNQKLLLKRKLKLGAIFFAITCTFVAPILVIDNFTLLSVILSGIIMLASGTLYEYITDSKIAGGNLNEY